MKIFLDGWAYMIKDLGRDEIKALLRMIKGAGLCERRHFHELKKQIEELEKNELL